MNQTIYYEKIVLPLGDLCQQWGILEFSIYGFSVAQKFQASSHVNCLVEFSEEAHWSSLEMLELQRQLSQLFGREVDVVVKDGMVNPFMLGAIHEEYQVLYSIDKGNDYKGTETKETIVII